MSEHQEHRRNGWPIRRLQDMVVITVLLGFFGTCVTLGVGIVRKHSKWMDRIAEIQIFDQEIKTTWIPRIVDNTKAIAVIEAKFDLIQESLRKIEKRLERSYK